MRIRSSTAELNNRTREGIRARRREETREMANKRAAGDAGGARKKKRSGGGKVSGDRSGLSICYRQPRVLTHSTCSRSRTLSQDGRGYL